MREHRAGYANGVGVGLGGKPFALCAAKCAKNFCFHRRQVGTSHGLQACALAPQSRRPPSTLLEPLAVESIVRRSPQTPRCLSGLTVNDDTVPYLQPSTHHQECRTLIIHILVCRGSRVLIMAMMQLSSIRTIPDIRVRSLQYLGGLLTCHKSCS